MLAGSGLALGDPAQPPALVEAIRARAAIRSARFDYLERFLGRDEPMNRFITYRAAGADYLQIDHGDERGVVTRVRDRPDEPICDPGYVLVTDGQSWHRNGSYCDVVVSPWEERALPDMRTLGIDPTGMKDLQYDKRIAQTGGTIDYHQEHDGALWRVIGDGPDGIEFAWWIDPERGWNVVRSSVSEKGEVWYTHEITLKQMDGVWFPSRVRRFRGPSEDGVVIHDLQILRAEINQPEHPKRLTPSDIGVESGMLIDDGRPGMADIWDGEKPMNQIEYYAKVADGELQPGPTVVRMEKRAELLTEEATGAVAPPAPSAAPPTAPATTQPTAPLELAEWEAYTLSFIRRHELDAGQSERALVILRDCQDSARALVLRRAMLAAPPQGKSRADDRDRVRAAEQRAAVERRIESIFQRELVPRLDSLLTVRQRELAAPTSGDKDVRRTP